jgi:hypothetical protein
MHAKMRCGLFFEHGENLMAFRLEGGAYDAQNVNLRGVEFHNVGLTGASIRDACLGDFTIQDGSYESMRIEGILVTELLRVYREHEAE